MKEKEMSDALVRIGSRTFEHLGPFTPTKIEKEHTIEVRIGVKVQLFCSNRRVNGKDGGGFSIKIQARFKLNSPTQKPVF